MRQYKTLIISIFFISVLALSKVNALVKDYTLLGKTIYLDAGHGGADSGAISKHIIEKDMNLKLVKLLESKLIEKGAVVYLTRNGDYDLAGSKINRKRNDLYKRATLINNSNCDIYISIHLNATTERKWGGMQVFYDNINKENKILAEVITKTLKSNLNNVKDYKLENKYYMYSKIKKPGILFEAGFVSNPNDNYKLRQGDYQNKLINNIVIGIESYFNS